MKSHIIWFMEKCTLICDGKCDQAWGHNWIKEKTFPAPEDPGTYEGGFGKPSHIDLKHNKWCARECERSTIEDVWI